MTAEGEIETPLDEDAVRRATRRLRKLGVRSIAVAFLHSYLNPAHEARARADPRRVPRRRAGVALARGVSEATRVRAHVDHARQRVRRSADRAVPRPAPGTAPRLRLHGELLIATSAGGVATPAVIGSRAVATIGSGPTGGVVAAARAATAAGLGDVVSVDMGGTSYDVCLIRDGRPELRSDWNWRHRYCIALPMVDIASIGAGGGSIARRRRHPARRSRVGRIAAGPGLLRRGGTRADRHRRRPRPRPARRERLLGRSSAPRRRRGAARARNVGLVAGDAASTSRPPRPRSSRWSTRT